MSFRLRQNTIMPNKAAKMMVPQTIAAMSRGKGMDIPLALNVSGKVPKKKIYLSFKTYLSFKNNAVIK